MLLEDLDPGLFVTPQRLEHPQGYSGVCACVCVCVANRLSHHLMLACSQADGLGACKKLSTPAMMPRNTMRNLSRLQKHHPRGKGGETGVCLGFRKLNQRVCHALLQKQSWYGFMALLLSL